VITRIGSAAVMARSWNSAQRIASQVLITDFICLHCASKSMLENRGSACFSKTSDRSQSEKPATDETLQGRQPKKCEAMGNNEGIVMD